MASKPKGFDMRRLVLSTLAVLAVLAIAPAFSATKSVDITQAGFTPSKVTIDFGDSVTWTNKDTANHQVLADQGAFPTSPVLQANQTYPYKFTKSGNFRYRDALNPKRRGTITVRAGHSLTAAQSFVGKYVVLQRYVRIRRAWKTVKRVTLRTVKPGTAPTMVSSARFRARVARKTRLRVLLIQSQAGSCYAPARSAAIRA